MVESFIRYLHVFNLVSTFLLIHLQAVYVSALCFVAYKTSRWVPKKLPFYGKELNNLSAIKLDIFFGVLPPGVTFHSSYPSFEKFTRRLYKPLSKVVYCAAKSVLPTHSVEKANFFCHLDFTWNQSLKICCFNKLRELRRALKSEYWFLWIFCTFSRLEFRKLKNFRVKWQFWNF